jgi:membrane-associated phospholipid phosphatase
MDELILHWLHGYSSPTLDAAFLVSNALGLGIVCIPLVGVMIASHLARGQKREAGAWLLVGLATWALVELTKAVVGRPRPILWPRLVEVSGFSFPSGHALAGMSLYPLLGWIVLRSRPGWQWAGFAGGVLVGLFIGVGRLYLGVHWPSDVVAGWALGLALSACTVAWLRGPPSSAVHD